MEKVKSLLKVVKENKKWAMLGAFGVLVVGGLIGLW